MGNSNNDLTFDDAVDKGMIFNRIKYTYFKSLNVK